MTRIDRRTMMALTGAGLMGAALACPAVGRAQDRDAWQREGGIGGTGIVGTLTDFGSVVVNGLRIGTSGRVRVTTALGRARADVLGIGQTVTVEARGGTLEARRIHVDHPVIGRVESAPGGRARVAGVPVVLVPGAVGTLRAGEIAAVSGVWRGAEVVASRVDPARTDRVVIAGEVAAREGRTILIGARRVVLGRFGAPAVGRFVTVLGQDRGDAIHADTLRQGRFEDAAGPLAALSVEGYLVPQADAPFFAVSGLGHSFARRARLAPFAGRRALFVGPYDRRFDVRAGLVLPEALGGRRALGRALLAGGGPAPIPAR